MRACALSTRVLLLLSLLAPCLAHAQVVDAMPQNATASSSVGPRAEPAPTVVAPPAAEAPVAIEPGVPAFAVDPREAAAIELRIRELSREIDRLHEATLRANRRKPLILLGLGTTAFVGAGLSLAVAPTDSGVVGAVVLGGVGTGLLVSSMVSGLVRRGKRGFYAGKIERREREIERLRDRLSVSLSLTSHVQAATVGLRF